MHCPGDTLQDIAVTSTPVLLQWCHHSMDDYLTGDPHDTQGSLVVDLLSSTPVPPTPPPPATPVRARVCVCVMWTWQEAMTFCILRVAGNVEYVDEYHELEALWSLDSGDRRHCNRLCVVLFHRSRM
jgi:hypothetical protein